MKLVYLNSAFFPGTSANKIARIKMANSFSKISKLKKVEFYFFANRKKMGNKNGKLEYKPIRIPLIKDLTENNTRIQRIYRYLFGYFLIIFYSFYTLYKLKLDKEDIMFIRGESFLFASFFFSILKSKPFSFELHNYEFRKNKIKDFFYKKIMKKAKKIITISEYTKKTWIKEGIDQKKIIVFPSGVDIKRFGEIKERKEKLKLKLSLSKNKIIACYVGSLHENRGIEEILEIAREFTFIDFVIIGGPKLRLEYYKDLISRKYRSLKNVILLGHLSNSLIPKYLKGSDILLAPYSKKIKTVDHMSPIKLIEYMASKTPIITSDLPRIRELLDESTSTFFMPDDIESLKKKLVFVSKNYALCKKKAQKAYIISKKYSWNNRAKKIFEEIK